jgi:hypothetical protein
MTASITLSILFITSLLQKRMILQPCDSRYLAFSTPYFSCPKFRTHVACPVPVGIIKAVEIEAKLALPTDVVIKLSKTKSE